MSNRLLAIFLFVLMISCESECPQEVKEAAFNQRMENFEAWKQSLNFLDEGHIDEARMVLDSCLVDQLLCFPMDSIHITWLDSIEQWHLAPRPSSENMKRATNYKLQIVSDWMNILSE